MYAGIVISGAMRNPMKFMKKEVIISALLMTTLSSGAVAQRSFYYNDESTGTSGVVNPTGHYNHWEYFGAELVKTDPLIPQALRPKKSEKEKKEEKKKEPTPEPVEMVSAKPDPLKMPKEEFDKYVKELAGDPSDTPYLEPSSDAPPAFKAMQACLQRGDYDCANKYAEKYTKGNALAGALYHQTKKLTENKLRKQGYMGQSIDSENPDYENLSILESGPQDKMAESSNNGTSGNSAQGSDDTNNINKGKGIGQLPGTVEQLLREGERREDQYINKNRDIVAPPKDDTLGGGEVLRMLSIPEDKQRKQASDQYNGVLPKDENGAVRVYFFFRQQDLNAYAMFPVLERVYQAHKDDKGFMLLAFSLSQMTDAELTAMKAKVKVGFPLRSGSVIAGQMDITHSPTTLVVAPSSGNYAREEGIRGFGFVDELVKIVDGSGPTRKASK